MNWEAAPMSPLPNKSGWSFDAASSAHTTTKPHKQASPQHLLGLVLPGLLLLVAEGPPTGAELLANLTEGEVGLVLDDLGAFRCNVINETV